MVAWFYGRNGTVVYKWRIAVSSLLDFKQRLGAWKCCINAVIARLRDLCDRKLREEEEKLGGANRRVAS